jgi:CheY-like chemotaxis protein
MAKILLIDDDRDFCESLLRYLSALGYRATCEADGRAGLGALMRDNHELVVLDLRMPIMNGLDFLRVVRSYVRFKSLPIVVVTGIDDAETLSQIHSFGVTKVLMKGNFEFADVRREIEKALVV